MSHIEKTLEPDVQALGRELWQEMQGSRPSIFARDFWANKLLDWSMDDPAFKVDLFRLVDVLPSLQTTDALQQHLDEYLNRPGRTLPKAVAAAIRLSKSGFGGGMAASAMRAGITEMARRFIAGSDLDSAMKTLRHIHGDGFLHTVDLLGEATLSAPEADSYQARYLALIERLSQEVTRWKSNDHNETSPLANISLKLSALEPHLDSADPDGSVMRALRCVMPILEAARAVNVFVNLDIEQYASHEITYRLFEQALQTNTLRDWPHLGIVVQAYCVYAENYLERMHALAARRHAPITIRLVKGAYWDYEIANAAQHGHRTPVYTQKSETDANFERLNTWLLDRRDNLFPAFGSHNLRSVVHAIVEAQKRGAGTNAFEIQTLYGMAEPLRNALLRRGHRVRVYCPIGELLPGMAYLVRRLLENTSNEGFLRQSYHEDADLDSLLVDPALHIKPNVPAPVPVGFRNAPHIDFAHIETQQIFAREAASLPARFPIDVPAVIAGKEIRSGAPTPRVNPAAVDQIVANVFDATPELARQAVSVAAKTWSAWRDRPLAERAALLLRLADRLEADRDNLAALQVYEVAKPWREADADVTEAIDFCRYYAHRAPIELGPERLGNMYGETNDLFYEGRGVAAVIAPWNFPLAILCGMTTAALVTGNTVIMKPAGQSSATAYALFTRMMETGFPPEVVQFLPGAGESVGAALVEHPEVIQLAFTGSKAVGLSIIECAAKTAPGQRQVKRVVCEMGGKNAIIVDADADLDETISGILYSAFGYAGQKCSACSRVVAVGDVYKPLVERLTAACASLTVGAPNAPGCQVPPVVDERAHRRLMDIVHNSPAGARRIFMGPTPDHGWYVPVTLFEVDDAGHALMQQELFGPILTLMRAATFDDALMIALNSEFALTGGVYSRLPSHLDAARRKFRVGNLYLNRGSTGAMVGRQAFGGFHMSGVGTKAGGPGYLRHFADPRSITENTMRRGFAPEETT